MLVYPVCLLSFYVLFALNRGSRELQGYQVSVGSQDHRLAGFNDIGKLKMVM